MFNGDTSKWFEGGFEAKNIRGISTPYPSMTYKIVKA